VALSRVFFAFFDNIFTEAALRTRGGARLAVLNICYHVEIMTLMRVRLVVFSATRKATSERIWASRGQRRPWRSGCEKKTSLGGERGRARRPASPTAPIEPVCYSLESLSKN